LVDLLKEILVAFVIDAIPNCSFIHSFQVRRFIGAATYQKAEGQDITLSMVDEVQPIL
jgi:hypothetical protein